MTRVEALIPLTRVETLIPSLLLSCFAFLLHENDEMKMMEMKMMWL